MGKRKKKDVVPPVEGKAPPGKARFLTGAVFPAVEASDAEPREPVPACVVATGRVRRAFSDGSGEIQTRHGIVLYAAEVVKGPTPVVGEFVECQFAPNAHRSRGGVAAEVWRLPPQ